MKTKTKMKRTFGVTLAFFLIGSPSAERAPSEMFTERQPTPDLTRVVRIGREIRLEVGSDDGKARQMKNSEFSFMEKAEKIETLENGRIQSLIISYLGENPRRKSGISPVIGKTYRVANTQNGLQTTLFSGEVPSAQERKFLQEGNISFKASDWFIPQLANKTFKAGTRARTIV